MERYKAKKLAESVGLIFVGGDPVGDHFVDKMTQFASLVEQETLERAAGACDEFAGSQIDAAKQSGDSYCNLRASGAHACSMRIRNLKDNHDKE